MNKERGEWDVIHTYTAEEALQDGLLTEVLPQLRREAGYQVPVRLTIGVSHLLTPTDEEREQGQTRLGRLWDTLYLARIAISNAERTAISAEFDITIGKKTTSLFACLDSTSGPAIHIITPQEY